MSQAKKLYQRLVDQPEAVRRRLFIVIMVLVAPLIFGLWFWSLELRIAKSERSVSSRSFILPATMLVQFRQGLANVRELLADLNLDLPPIFGRRDFKLNPRPIRSPLTLPLDNGR